MTASTAFAGIPPATMEFYEQLEADNSRAFWQANKQRYQDVVKQPVEALCVALDEYGPFHLFRPYTDQRFAKGRPPYKTAQGAYGESEGGAGYYFQVSAQGLMCGTGYYAMAKDQLARFRAAVDAESTGTEIAGIVAGLARRYSVGAIDELKSAPRGFAKDHPRVELLRRKGLMISKEFGAPTWLHTKRAASRVRSFFADGDEMNAWLDAHVGPSTLEPDGMFPS
jgi:uncharacterized protein (TIGR02453 family)